MDGGQPQTTKAIALSHNEPDTKHYAHLSWGTANLWCKAHPSEGGQVNHRLL